MGDRLLKSAGVAYVAAAIIGGVLLWNSRAFYHDDAFISLRYVQRLLDGQGLNWNPGERVEGFSHPLWVAQLAFLGWLGIDLPTATRVLGVAYYFAVLALWYIARAAPVMLLVAATLPGIVVWSVSGLETVSFAFWLSLGGWLAQASYSHARSGNAAAWRHAALAGAALGAAALTRPEGCGVAVLALGWLALTGNWRALFMAELTFTATFAPYLVFRFLYFGELVPNTAHVKLADLALSNALIDGAYYFWNQRPTWLPAAATTFIALTLSQTRIPLLMLTLTLPLLFTTLAAGGDHMIAGRLLAPAMLLAVLAGGIALREGRPQHPFILHCVLISAVACHIACVLFLSPVRDAAAAVGEPVGQWLEQALPRGTVVSTATAGSVPYFAPSLTFIDSLGLNDRHIARRRITKIETTWQRIPGHLKGDGAYVLARAPDVIILGPADGYAGQDPRAWFLTDFELLQSAEFRARYRGYVFPVPITPLQVLNPAVARHTRPDLILPLTAFVRNDSAVAPAFVARGVPLG